MAFPVYAGDLGRIPKERAANVQSAQKGGCRGRGKGRKHWRWMTGEADEKQGKCTKYLATLARR